MVNKGDRLPGIYNAYIRGAGAKSDEQQKAVLEKMAKAAKEAEKSAQSPRVNGARNNRPRPPSAAPKGIGSRFLFAARRGAC